MRPSDIWGTEVESLVLGCALRGQYRALEGRIFPSDLISTRHQVILGEMDRLAATGEVGIERLAKHLYDSGKLDAAGGLAYLTHLHGAADNLEGSPVEGFVSIVGSLSRKRRALRVASKLRQEIEANGIDGSEAIAELTEELRGLTQRDREGKREILSLDDLPPVGDSDEDVRYLITPEVPEGTVVALTGAAASGKSTVATAWVRDVIAQGRPALVLDRDNPEFVVRGRMRRLGLENGPLLRWFGGWTGEVPLPDAPIVITWIEKQSTKPLVVIDSLIGFLDGADENSATDMRRFMSRARRLADLGAAVVILHHEGKGERSRDYRGSTDFPAAIDQGFHCTNSGIDGHLERVRLRCFKSRLGLAGELVYRYADGQMVRDEAQDAPLRTQEEQLRELLKLNPGVTQTAFEDLGMRKDIPRRRIRDWLNSEAGVACERRAGNARHYYLRSEDVNQ